MKKKVDRTKNNRQAKASKLSRQAKAKKTKVTVDQAKNRDNKQQAQSKYARRSKITLVVLIVLLVIALGFSVYAYQRYARLYQLEACLTCLEPAGEAKAAPEGEIAQGIRYKSADLGGKTYAEAVRTIENSEENLLKNLGSYTFIYSDDKDGVLRMTPYDLGLRLDIDAIMEEAIKESRKIFGRKVILNDAFRIDESAFQAGFTKLKEEVNQDGGEARAIDFNFETSEFVFEDEREERKLLGEDKLERQIRDALTKKEFTKEVKLDVKISEAGKTAKELNELLGFVDSASTPIMSYSEARNMNVKLAADRIHGTIINPGESFSFHQTIGPMTQANGFVAAGVQDQYGNDSLGVGGGLCQPSTTLYIAAVRANMRIDVHNFHSTPVNYTPIGTDCMVSDWSDLVFTNTSDYPYVITAYFDGATLSFSFYGPANPDNAKIDLYVEELEQIKLDKEPIEEQNDEIPADTTEVKVAPRPNRHVKVYRNFYGTSGQLLKSELMYDHTYPGFEGVVYVNKKDADKTDPSSGEAAEIIYYEEAPDGSLIPVYRTKEGETVRQTSPPPIGD